MQVQIDVSDVTSRQELHARIAAALDFPEWYGRNLDALHDCLTDLHEPTELTVIGWEALEEAVGGYARRFRYVLRDSAAENPNFRLIPEE